MDENEAPLAVTAYLMERVRRVAAEPIMIVAPRDMGFHQILKAKFSLPDR